LANILFDDLRLAEVAEDFEPRVRKQALSAFWKRLVHADTLAQVSRAQSAEEKAFVYLSGGMVEEACMALIDGKDFHLATLVAQIGGDKTFRAAMATQLESWRQLNVLPEIDDHIRAIWELLAGNTSICEGQTVAGIENKVASFSFSSRFKIDWRRSFGLRLWYGIEAADDPSVAVKKFRSDLKSHTETAKPAPWFVQKGVEQGWNDSKSSTCEDVLWSMLRLYTNNASVALDTAFAPENVSGNPMDARLSFQLVYLFSARGIGSTTSGPASADDLATTYASCLSASIASNSDALWYACWALLHLSEPQARVQSVRALLDQHAAVLDPDGKVFNELLNLRIPSSWMYLSRALYARAVEQDPVMEAQCLIEAGEWSQAHDVVCRVVGPKAVIEGDSDQLRELLGSLVDRSSTNQAIWDKGAGVYYDYIEMKDLELRKGQRWKELVRRVASALKGIMTEGLQGKDLTERAALQIMGRTVANIATSGDVLEKNEGLRLPLTEDAYLAQSRELSRDYFRALLASH
jgi:nuclear pore complex protein Nup98-Nup96